MTWVRLITGADALARQALVDELFLDAYPDAKLVLPGRALVRGRKAELIRGHSLPGLFGEPVLDLGTYVHGLLEGAGVVVQPLSSLERQGLLQGCILQLHASGDLDMLKVAPDAPGLLKHVLQVITELKQAAVDPETFARRVLDRENTTEEDVLISRVYGAYQEVLLSKGRHDVPGLYWEAALRCGETGFTEQVAGQYLFLDGFDDFTPSEFRFIEALSPHLSGITFGVHFDARPDRKDCFALSRRTLDRIHGTFDVEPTEIPHEDPVSWRRYVAETVFWRDEPRAPAGLREDVHVQACLDEQDEAAWCLRQVKQALQRGDIGLNDVAIASRRGEDLVEVLGALGDEYGVPLRMHSPMPLVGAPLVQRMLQLMQVVQQGDRDLVLNLLIDTALPWDDGCTPDLVSSFDRLSRHAHVTGPLESWPGALGSLAQRLVKDPSDDITHLKRILPNVSDCLAALQARVANLQTLVNPLKGEKTQADWVAVTAEMVEAMALDSVSGANAARESLYQVLEQLRVTASQSLSVMQWGLVLQRALGMASYMTEQPARGVAVLGLEQLRNRQFKHVYLLRMNEGVIPEHPGMNALYDTGDYQRLRGAGVVLEGHEEHRDREMLLYHHGLAAATEQLYLCWCINRGGREGSMSPYLAELQSLLPKDSAMVGSVPQSEALIAKGALAASLREARCVLVHEGTGDDGDAMLQPVQSAIAAEAARYETAAFGAHDGQLADDTSLTWLASHYDAQHCYSANQIHGYIRCPFGFYLERILGVQDVPVPKPGFDTLVRGNILHDTLEQFHRWLATQSDVGILDEAAQEELITALDAAFDRHVWKSRGATKGIAAAERRFLERRLKDYCHQEQARQAKGEWVPMAFETGFGVGVRNGKEAFASEEPFVVEAGGESMLFSGRIDRIDQWESNSGHYRIIDYKTGNLPTPGTIHDGHDIQLTLYAWYVDQRVGTPGASRAAHYLSPGKAKTVEALRLGDAKWEDREENAKASIVAAREGIRSGSFAPVRLGDVCYRCTRAHVCRYEQGRIERKAAVVDGEDGAS